MYFNYFLFLFIFPIIIVVGIILIIVLFRSVSKLKKRMAHMEKYLQKATKVFGQAKSTVSNSLLEKTVSSEGASSMSVEVSSEEKEIIIEDAGPGVFERFGTWLKEDWLMKLGGLLIVLGMAWFVNYAFVHEWIGPMGRISLGLIFGAFVLGLGRYRIASYVSQGGILMFVGALIMIFTVWVGHSDEYGFFSQEVALTMIFCVSAVLGITSIALKRLPLAYANVFLVAIAPMLVTFGNDSLEKLFTYLLVLSAGAVWVAVVTGWRQLVLAALLIVSWYTLPFLEGAYFGHEENGLIFSFIFVAMFFLVTIFGMRQKGKTKMFDFITAVVSGLFILVWILAGAAEEWQVMLLVAWTLVFAFGSFTALRIGASVGFFYSYAGVGIMLLGAATAVQLDGPTLTIAYIIEAFIILYTGLQVTRKVRIIPLFAIPSIIPIFMSF